jgi:hypothetical protein
VKHVALSTFALYHEPVLHINAVTDIRVILLQFSNADRRGSGLHTDEIIDWAGSLRSQSCSMFITTVYIGAKLDSDAQVSALCTCACAMTHYFRSPLRPTSGRE